MSRLVCHLDKGCLNLLCVNNYRGEDYEKPDSVVDCEDCIFNPENKGLLRNQKDGHKVIKAVEEKDE